MTDPVERPDPPMTSASAKDLAEQLLTMARISDAPGYVHLGAPAAMREAAALLTRYAEGKGPDDGWRSRETAPKDGTPIWAVFRSDIYPILRPGRPDLECWNGVQACIRHPGIAADGFDIGWNMAAPVGHGGFATEWIAGWRPLPSPPTDHTPEEET